MLNFTGRVFTDLYGNGGKANDTLDRDNNKVSIVGVFLGRGGSDHYGKLIVRSKESRGDAIHAIQFIRVFSKYPVLGTLIFL